MNSSVQPCDNFYQFVCGNFEKSVTFTDGYPKNSSFHTVYLKVQEQLRRGFESEFTVGKDPEVFLKLKSFYNVCMSDGNFIYIIFISYKRKFT